MKLFRFIDLDEFFLINFHQKSVNFVKQVVLEDEAKLTGIPSGDCSKIMLWSLRTSTKTPPANQHLPPVQDVSQTPSQHGT